MQLILWALFGLFGGDFAYRLADRTLEDDASGGVSWLPRCPRCGNVEGPLQRLAVLAIPLRRVCPGCGRRPGSAQLAVELITAAAIAVLAWRIADPIQVAIYALATIALVTVTVTDLRARIIPNTVTYSGTAAALALSLLPGAIGVVVAGFGLLAGAAVGLLMLALGLLVYRRPDVFGLGDVKLAAFIGAVSGFPVVLTAIVAGVVIGGVLALAVVIRGRSRRGTMPYGPALAIGAYLTWLLQ